MTNWKHPRFSICEEMVLSLQGSVVSRNRCSVCEMVLCQETSEVSRTATSDLVPMGRWQCQKSIFWEGAYEELALKHPVSDSAYEEMVHPQHHHCTLISSEDFPEKKFAR